MDYAERQRCGERASTDLVESAANQVLAKRFVKRPRMQRTKGAYLLVQARPKVLNEGWEACFRWQYPDFRLLPARALLIAA